MLLSMIVTTVSRFQQAAEIELLNDELGLIARFRRIAPLFDGGSVGCFVRCVRKQDNLMHSYYVPVNLRGLQRVHMRLHGPGCISREIFASFQLALNTAVRGGGVFKAHVTGYTDTVLVSWLGLPPCLGWNWFYPLSWKWTLSCVRAYAEREKLFEAPQVLQCTCTSAHMRKYTVDMCSGTGQTAALDTDSDEEEAIVPEVSASPEAVHADTLSEHPGAQQGVLEASSVLQTAVAIQCHADTPV